MTKQSQIPNTSLEYIISEFLDLVQGVDDEGNEHELGAKVRELVVAAVSHGVYSGLDAVLNGITLGEGEAEVEVPVTMSELLDESSDILDKFFSQTEEDEEEEDDAELEKELASLRDTEDGKTIEEDLSSLLNLPEVEAAVALASIDKETQNAQQALNDQTNLEAQNFMVQPGWIRLPRNTKGRKAN